MIVGCYFGRKLKVKVNFNCEKLEEKKDKKNIFF